MIKIRRRLGPILLISLPDRHRRVGPAGRVGDDGSGQGLQPGTVEARPRVVRRQVRVVPRRRHDGPELWGDAFLTQWENKDVGGFFTRIQTTMPEDAPGSLGEKEVLDIIAYVIQTNGFPAGDKELESAKALATIKFVKKK
jgi:hypothetical protein